MLVQAFREFFQFVPYPYWVLVGTALALLGQIVLVTILWRRRARWLLWEEQISQAQARPLVPPNPRLLWHWLTFGLSLPLFLAPCLLAATTNINRIVSATSPLQIQDKGALYALGTSGQLTLHSVAIPNSLLFILLAIVSFSLLITERWRVRRHGGAAILPRPHSLTHLPSADDLAAVLGVFFLLGLGPILLGGFKQGTLITRKFQTMLTLPGEQRPQAMIDFLDQAQRTLDDLSRWGALGLILAVALFVFVMWPRRQPGEAIPADEKRAWAWTVGLSLGCLAAGVALLGLAAPFRAEAQTAFALPARVSPIRWPLDGPSTPKLQGPDQAGFGPMLEMMNQQVLLDGDPVDYFGLARGLGAALNRQLEQGSAEPKCLTLVAETTVPMPILRSVLFRVRNTGYESVDFVFTEREEHQRPILGKLLRINATAATAWLTEPGHGDAILRPERFSEYQDFATTLVELRRSGQRVNLDLAVKGYEPALR